MFPCIVMGYSPSWWGRHRGRSLRKLVTLLPLSERWILMLSSHSTAHGPVVKCSLLFYSHLAVSMIFPVLLCTREALTTRHSRFGGKKGHVSSYQESQLVYFLFSSSRNGTQGLACLSKCSIAEPCTHTLFVFDRVSVAYGSLKLIILLLLSAECWDCRYALSHLL